MSRQPLLPIGIPTDHGIGTLDPMMAASLSSTHDKQHYVHHGRRYDFRAPDDSREATLLGYLPHTCTRCGHDLQAMRHQQQAGGGGEQVQIPEHAVSFVLRPDSLMPTYAELSDFRRYAILVLFCLTVLAFSGIFKYFQSPPSLDSIEVPDYRACSLLTLMCFAGLGAFSVFKYWQSESRMIAGRYSEALKAARIARDAALLTIGTGIGLAITAAAIVKSS